MEQSEGTLAMLTLDAQGGEPILSTPTQSTNLLELIVPDSVEPDEFAIDLSSPSSPKSLQQRISSDEEFVANTPDRESTPPVTGWELAIVPPVPTVQTPTQSDIRLSAELNEGMEFVRRDEDLNIPEEEVRRNSPRIATPSSQPQNQQTPQPKNTNKPATSEAGSSRRKKKSAVRKTNQLMQKELRMLDEKRAIVNEQLSKITKKPVLQEQGFAEDLSRYLPSIRFEVEQRSWGEFCIVWEEARIEWVYEFFANIFKRDSHVSYVQGRRIFWNSRAWNKMYGLEDIESDYEVLMETLTDEDRDDCIKTICREGAKWDEGLKAKRIIASDLTNEAKFWAAFVRTCLMPTTHETTLTVPRAMLIYCIMAGHSINVGRIIEDEIYQWAGGGKKACRTIFPHAISMLLATQGVPRTPKDIKLTKKKPLPPPKQTTAPSKQTSTKPRSTPIRNPANPPANPLPIPSLSEDLLTQILAEQRDMKTRQLAFYKYYAEREKVEQSFFDMIDGGPTFPPFPSWVVDPNSLNE